MFEKKSLERIMQNPTCKTLEFSTPSKGNSPYVREAIRFVVGAFLENYGGRDSDSLKVVEGSSMDKVSDDVRLTAGELIANAVENGNCFDSEKKVKVYCSWFGRKFYFAVVDEGNGFDMSKEGLSGGGPERGLGIGYSRQAMDLVYNFKDSAAYAYKKVVK